MTKQKEYIYHLGYFMVLAVLFEFLFWIAFLGILKALGYFNTSSTGEHFLFLSFQYIWVFLLIPLVLSLFIIQIKRRERLIRHFSLLKDKSILLTKVSTKRLLIKYLLVRNIIGFSALALMMPSYGYQSIYGEESTTEMVFAVDLSNSMNTRDMEGEVSRLTVAKRMLNQVVNQAKTSQIGLVIFAGNAYVQFPLTSDQSIVKMYLDGLSTNLISNQGTNISSALQKSKELYSHGNVRKVLVLITDGEDHEGNMEIAYQSLLENGIELLVIGVGTEKGGIIPESGSSNTRYMKDREGQAIKSVVNRKMLEEIAREAKGEMILTNAAFPNIYQILTQINNNSEQKRVNLEFQIKANRYRWPLTIAILCFLFLLMRGWKMKVKE